MSKYENIHDSLQHLAVSVDSLTPDPRNARKHDRRNLNAIKSSLERFGFRQPLVVQKQGMIVRAGNGRLAVAKELGWTHIPAIVVDEGEAEALAYAITDNRTAELAEWNLETLGDIMNDLVVEDFDVSSLGWAAGEMEYLIQHSALSTSDLGTSTSKTTSDASQTTEDLEDEDDAPGPQEFDTDVADDVEMGRCPHCETEMPLGEYGRAYRAEKKQRTH